MNPEDLQLLVTREMPYGKYKGRRIADLPGNYLTWFAREGFPKGELGRLLALMHEIDHNGLSELLAAGAAAPSKFPIGRHKALTTETAALERVERLHQDAHLDEFTKVNENDSHSVLGFIHPHHPPMSSP
jgi:hypothetical protein